MRAKGRIETEKEKCLAEVDHWKDTISIHLAVFSLSLDWKSIVMKYFLTLTNLSVL